MIAASCSAAFAITVSIEAARRCKSNRQSRPNGEQGIRPRLSTFGHFWIVPKGFPGDNSVRA